MPAKVFISYAHKDRSYREQLETHLKILERTSVIEPWHDGEIAAGSLWRNEVEENLLNSQVILLLVSPDFITSDFCYETETNAALELRRLGRAVVIPILLRPCVWHGASFSSLQVVPADNSPIALAKNQDAAFVEIVNEIKRAVEALEAGNLASPTDSSVAPQPQKMNIASEVEQFLAHPDGAEAPEAGSGAAVILQSDRPVTLEESPLQQTFTRFALGIADFILEHLRASGDQIPEPGSAQNRPMLTIGLFADWGTGKSTLGELVLKSIRDHGYVTVNLNPWHWGQAGSWYDYSNQAVQRAFENQAVFGRLFGSARVIRTADPILRFLWRKCIDLLLRLIVI